MQRVFASLTAVHSSLGRYRTTLRDFARRTTLTWLSGNFVPPLAPLIATPPSVPSLLFPLDVNVAGLELWTLPLAPPVPATYTVCPTDYNVDQRHESTAISVSSSTEDRVGSFLLFLRVSPCCQWAAQPASQDSKRC